jgi:hypothetical protein
MRTQDALRDIWPFVYQLIHPSIRDVSPALFRADEVLALRMAIELMVAFDIELKSSSGDTHMPSFEPNITECVTFKALKGSILTLRPKTQILILQQYHRVKQEMLNGNSSEKVATPKASLVGVPTIFPVKKKRALADIPADEE